jgi:transcriptional regulator with XRE-family HTH domain
MPIAKRRKHRQSHFQMKRNSTIDDVAKAAGVARVTVSRVLNNVANVRPETRERVRRAVESLGYSVNQQARALASGAGRQIMLIHAHNPEREPNSYYHAGLELGALRACSSLGLDLVTRAIDPEDEIPAKLMASILEHERPLGIIVPPPMADDLDLIASAQRAGVKMVAISAGEYSRTLVSAVGIDDRQAGMTDSSTRSALPGSAKTPGSLKGISPSSRALRPPSSYFANDCRSPRLRAPTMTWLLAQCCRFTAPDWKYRLQCRSPASMILLCQKSSGRL